MQPNEAEEFQGSEPCECGRLDRHKRPLIKKSGSRCCWTCEKESGTVDERFWELDLLISAERWRAA